MKISESVKSLAHHAYCLVGGETVHDELVSMLEKVHSIQVRGDVDFFNKKYLTFTIDDARELKSNHEMRPVGKMERRIFVIAMNGITIEAQNALLKLLEEPADYAHFFIVISSAHLLLPTVKSRLLFVETGDVLESDGFAEAEKFLKMSVAKRLEYIKTLTDEIKDEKKTKQDAVDLLNAIQAFVYKGKGAMKGSRELETIEFARKYMNDTSSSPKMLLEYVALRVIL